jgi:hypothetical protein
MSDNLHVLSAVTHVLTDMSEAVAHIDVKRPVLTVKIIYNKSLDNYQRGVCHTCTYQLSDHTVRAAEAGTRLLEQGAENKSNQNIANHGQDVDRLRERLQLCKLEESGHTEPKMMSVP